MGRRKRNQPRPACYHLTHRCHGRDFLLKFRKDRHKYLLRLHEMARRCPVDVLTYMITCNHIHLLLWSECSRNVSRAMHFLQGTVAGDYNRRKSREGAFWRGRYHPTLVESGSHLSRCLFYIDLNMIRAGACNHAAEWLGGACKEILGGRHRYRIINRERLKWCLGLDGLSEDRFADWYNLTMTDQIRRGYLVRKPFWSEALAVGSKEWIAGLMPVTRNVRVEVAEAEGTLAEEEDCYALYAPDREARDLWHDLL